ncbi:VOC family protein [Paeniglutamicibacter kerguelensis]|uniref:3-demethylubiquinone-9 3-methyltransferase (Glyoxalase superfamily) n=1 Tax=Paeniglutamicibacter kerguelensis TaxID=254788 RepID=A0ABS4XFD4_9MICC|nr:VOC family protein [Paeniglutamicibacter kerguelensis]MBP2387169.1 putative 3-demethylubiquinone-9 3-methyltransferase (glyoxalase superfamily) [Paeniglutamicibacter kerguelensis]
MKNIVTCLWFDQQGLDAARFYTSIFPNSEIGTQVVLDENGQPATVPLTVDFSLNGSPFVALNGGPMFSFNEAVSFQIMCQDQAEVDYYWDALTAGGEESQCGWLKDRFGVSWQVVPTRLPELLGQGDPEVARKVMEAFMPMRKFDIAALERAAVS